MDATTPRRARGFFARLVPPANEPVAGWHVSPAVDIAAYHLSWLWILIPLALAGDLHPKDYLGLWAIGMTLSFLHRQYTMPYVYLDKSIFSQHVTRFTLFFALLMLGAVASVFMTKWKAPVGFFRPIDVTMVLAGAVLVAQSVVGDKRGHKFSPPTLAAVAAPFVLALVLGLTGHFTGEHIAAAAVVSFGFAGASIFAAKELKRSFGFPIAVVALAGAGALLTAFADRPLNANDVVKGSALVGVVGAFAAIWNVWHTLMQKFGILRVYAAKSSVPLERRTPPWVDRLLIFGGLPFLAVWVGPAQRDVLAKQAKSVTQYLLPIVDALTFIQPVAVPVAAALAVFSLACFVYFEWRADRLRCAPRLSMALALTALNASFLVMSPLKVYIAYGFSHAIEYMVFVWAFLRRRYATPQAPEPVIQRALARPVLSYALFSLAIGGAFFAITFGKDYGLHEGGITLFGAKVSTWFFSLAIWQSMAHFYFDGFLWKMRAPSVRASL